MSDLLEVIDLTKQYGPLTAVDHISFGIPQGCCFGLLGPNGAGKTTTIEMIEGVTSVTSGEILFRGQPRNASFAESAGIQFQNTALMSYLSVREVLNLFSGLYRNSLPINEIVERCELSQFLDRKATQLSGGQKQRLLLGLALLNDPEIIFLDEPTTGLDPQSRRNFWSLIEELKRDGKTVVLTTHYMDEAEFLCDELIIIDEGKIIEQGAPQELLSRHLPEKRICLPKDQAGALESQNLKLETDGGEIALLTDDIQQGLQTLLSTDADLSQLRVRNPTLEDLFIHLTGHQLREQ